MGANDYFVQTPEQRAWSEAHEQYEREAWDRIDRGISNRQQGWRTCPVRHCRREKGCRDDSLVCLDHLLSKRPQRRYTEEQYSWLQFKLRKKLERYDAELIAQGKQPGEYRARRIAELLRERLAANGIAQAPKGK